jgi:hypothetical protein
MMQYLVYAVLGVCSARCMLTQCSLMIIPCRDREERLKFVFCNDGTEREMGDEDGKDMEDASG